MISRSVTATTFVCYIHGMRDSKIYLWYCRVSNNDYIKSIDQQKELIEKLADDNDIEKKDLIVFWDEKSWKSEGWREQFLEMIKILQEDLTNNKKPENRKYAWIICFKIDRLARNDKDFTVLMDLLKNWYEIISVTETIENTPTWRLLFRMLASFAVYESEKLSSRISFAQLQSLVSQRYDSLWWNYKAQFWFTLTKEDQQWIRDFKIVDEQADVVRKIFTLAAKEPSIKPSQIVKKLSDTQRSVLLKHKKSSKSTQDLSRLVGRILKDDKMLRYNWTIVRKLSVNDELIVRYINWLIESNELNLSFSIDWSTKLWWEIEFVFYHPELSIVNDLLYSEVKTNQRIKSDKRVRFNRDAWYFWLFDELVDIEYKWEIMWWRTSPKSKKMKTWDEVLYYYYDASFTVKNTTKKKKESFSEKKIEEWIKASWVVNDILQYCWSPRQLEAIQRCLIEYTAGTKLHQRKWIIARINIYKYRVKYFKEERDKASWDDVYFFTKRINRYDELVRELEVDRDNLDANNNQMIEKYTSLLKLNNFFDLDEYTRRIFYATMFEKIVVSKSEADLQWYKIDIRLNPLIVEVWKLKVRYTYDTWE